MSNPFRYCSICGQNKLHNPLCIDCGTITDTNIPASYRTDISIYERKNSQQMQASRKRGQANLRNRSH